MRYRQSYFVCPQVVWGRSVSKLALGRLTPHLSMQTNIAFWIQCKHRDLQPGVL